MTHLTLFPLHSPLRFGCCPSKFIRIKHQGKETFPAPFGVSVIFLRGGIPLIDGRGRIRHVRRADSLDVDSPSKPARASARPPLHTTPALAPTTARPLSTPLLPLPQPGQAPGPLSTPLHPLPLPQAFSALNVGWLLEPFYSKQGVKNCARQSGFVRTFIIRMVL